jgi:hypothetical protein
LLILFRDGENIYFQSSHNPVQSAHINHQTEELFVILPLLLVQEQIVSAHLFRLKEKNLLEKLIAKKCFLGELIDKPLVGYEIHENGV